MPHRLVKIALGVPMIHRFICQLKKHCLYLFVIPVSLLLICSIFYYRTNHSFLDFSDAFFKSEITSDTLNLHYTLKNPEVFGIKNYPVTLGDADPESLANAYNSLENWRNSLLDYSRSWLSRQNRLTYDILNMTFQTQMEGRDFLLYGEPLGASLGTQAQLPVLLAEYAFSDKKDIEEYLILLSQIPDYYDDLLTYEQAKSKAGLFMNDEMAQGIIDQCSAFLDSGEHNVLLATFETRLSQVDGLSGAEKQNYIDRNQTAVETCVLPAYQKLSDGLFSLMGSGTNDLGLCYYPKGKDYYLYLLKDSTGCYNSIDSILKRVQSQLDADIDELRKLVKNNPQLLSDTGAQSLSESVSNISNNPGEILFELRQKISDDFPDPPTASCSVKYVESSLEDYLSPAFYLTAPLDDPNQNIIYINRGAGYEGLDLYATLAHEGYPGHLYQTIFSQQAGYHPVRSLLNFSGFVEGWATYIEMMSFSYADVPQETAALYRLNRSLTLGLSSILDILIHYYGYDREQTAAFLEPFGFSEKGVADSFYNAILESPANYLKYYLGCLCFQDLKKAAQLRQGKAFSLKKFHKKILETGPCPFPILYKYVLDS